MTRTEAAHEAGMYRAGTHPEQAELRDYAQEPVEITLTEAVGYVLGGLAALACLLVALVACMRVDALYEAQPPDWVPVCASEAECAEMVRQYEFELSTRGAEAARSYEL